MKANTLLSNMSMSWAMQLFTNEAEVVAPRLDELTNDLASFQNPKNLEGIAVEFERFG